VKLSFSTNAFTRFSLIEAVRTIAGLGYQGVEILADRPHLFCPEVTPAVWQGLTETLGGLRLPVANVNANTVCGYYGRPFWEPLFEPGLANPDPEARRWRLDYTLTCLQLAHALGSPSISLTAGRMVPGVRPAESWAMLKDSLVEVLAQAQALEVRVGIEYEPGLLIENCEELLLLLTEIDSPWLGANLDLGHSLVAREDVCSVIASLGDKIFHVHLEDIKGHKHFHLIPGEGDFDFDRILDALAGNAYQGFVTVELYSYPERPAEAARLARDYLTQLPYWQGEDPPQCA